MTEKLLVDFVVTKNLKDRANELNAKCFKFNLSYGREVIAKNKKLEITKVKTFANNDGCFLIGNFSNIHDFTFGEWDKDTSSDSRYNNNKGGYVVKPELAPNPDEVICLFLPKSEKLEGYSGFEGLVKFIASDSSGGKIANSYLTLNLPDYTSFAVDADGKPIDLDTATVLLRLGKKQNRFEISFPELEADFRAIDAVEISDSFAAPVKGGYGSGSKVEINQENIKEKVLSRLELLETEDIETRIYSAYLKYRTTCQDDPDIYTGDFHFIDFLRAMIQ